MLKSPGHKVSGLFLTNYCFSIGNFVSLSCYMRNIPYLKFLVTLKKVLLMIKVSKIIKQERLRRGMTQESLAKYLNTTKTTISKWENARR